MIYRALTNAFATGYVGYGYGWRFSDAWSVLAATSDRVRLGGHLVNFAAYAYHPQKAAYPRRTASAYLVKRPAKRANCPPASRYTANSKRSR